MNLDALVDMSNRYGSNEEYVLAGGGNTSCKEDGIMYVKGSGSPLATIASEGFVAMDAQALRETLKHEYSDCMSPAEIEAESFAAIMAAKLPAQDNKRPSVESILHALFPYKYVLHVHPALVNGLTCSVDYESECERLFGGGKTPLAAHVGSVPPGPGLARLCCEAIEEAAKHDNAFPQIAFMQNHGVFAAADTVGEIDDLMRYIMDKLTSEVKEFPDFTETSSDLITWDDARFEPIMGASLSGCSPTTIFFTNKTIMSFVKNVETFEPVKKPLTPEQVIAYGEEVMFIEADEDGTELVNYEERCGQFPRATALCGHGFIALGNSKEETEIIQTMLLNAVKIAVYAKSFGGVNPLSEETVNTMLNYNPYELSNQRPD